MSEQQNVVSIDTFRVPQGTKFDDGDQLDLHKADPRLASEQEVTAARRVVRSVVEPLSAVNVESMRINNALAVGQWMERFRAEELRKAS